MTYVATLAERQLRRLSTACGVDISVLPEQMRGILAELGSKQSEEQMVQQWPVVRGLVGFIDAPESGLLADHDHLAALHTACSLTTGLATEGGIAIPAELAKFDAKVKAQRSSDVVDVSDSQSDDERSATSSDSEDAVAQQHQGVAGMLSGLAMRIGMPWAR